VEPCWGLTSRVNAGVTTPDRTGLERSMKALEPDFAELDGVIVQVERVIHLFRECGVEDLVAPNSIARLRCGWAGKNTVHLSEGET